MAAVPHRQLYHCGFVGDTEAGDGNLSLLQPELVTGFPTERQVAQLVGGGWGRACAVVTGDPPCLFSWGLTSNLPATGADPEPTYVRCGSLSSPPASPHTRQMTPDSPQGAGGKNALQ